MELSPCGSFSTPASVALALASLLATLASSGSALADFGDCSAPGYLYAVDDRMRDVAMTCDEAARLTIETPLGTRNVRIIYDTADFREELPDQVTAIREGIEASAAALRAIGEGTTTDLTVWASNLPTLGGASSPIEAATMQGVGECKIVAYSVPNLGFVVAHEFFHCVQHATVGMHKVELDASQWWVEGSAEWFANLAIAGTGISDDWIGHFDAGVNRTPLTSMEYESVVFFSWLSQNFLPSMVMALLTAMPGEGGEADQQDALAGFLSADDFQDFVQAYVDREILQPGGRRIPSAPTPNNVFVWERDRSHELDADRFVIVFDRLDFHCGIWTTSTKVEVEQGSWRVSRNQGPWQDLPERISWAGPGYEYFRLAGIGVELGGFTLAITAVRNPCERCRPMTADDESAACLVGGWTLASGGYGEQIQQRLQAMEEFESVLIPDPDARLLLSADGTYYSPPTAEEFHATVVDPDGDTHLGYGTLADGSIGFWSVDGDILSLCQTARAAELELIIVEESGSRDEFAAAGPTDTEPYRRDRTFTCSGDNLILVEDAPFMLAVIWEYRRKE